MRVLYLSSQALPLAGHLTPRFGLIPVKIPKIFLALPRLSRLERDTVRQTNIVGIRPSNVRSAEGSKEGQERGARPPLDANRTLPTSFRSILRPPSSAEGSLSFPHLYHQITAIILVTGTPHTFNHFSPIHYVRRSTRGRTPCRG